MANLTFNVAPSAAVSSCRILVGGRVVPSGSSLQVPVGDYVGLAVESDGGWELENWNDGEWFDVNWNVLVSGDRVFTAHFSNV